MCSTYSWKSGNWFALQLHMICICVLLGSQGSLRPCCMKTCCLDLSIALKFFCLGPPCNLTGYIGETGLNHCTKGCSGFVADIVVCRQICSHSTAQLADCCSHMPFAQARWCQYVLQVIDSMSRFYQSKEYMHDPPVYVMCHVLSQLWLEAPQELA